MNKSSTIKNLVIISEQINQKDIIEKDKIEELRKIANIVIKEISSKKTYFKRLE